MAGTRLLVHIRPDALPSRILRLLEQLAHAPEKRFGGIVEMNAHLAQQGLGKASEIESTVAMAQLLGLVERDGRGVGLSADGARLVHVRQSAQADLLHYRFYTLWRTDRPTEAVKSWSYRHCLDAYWETQAVQLTPQYLDQRAQATVNDAERTFGALGVYDLTDVSFSRKSLRAIHRWLAALQPPALADGRFSRRAICPPELLILALGWVLGQAAVDAGDTLLSREGREAICRVCLLEPTALDGALDWMLPSFPDIVAPGTTAGFYGRFIRLLRQPTLADVVR